MGFSLWNIFKVRYGGILHIHALGVSIQCHSYRCSYFSSLSLPPSIGRTTLYQLRSNTQQKAVFDQTWTRWRSQYGMRSLRAAASGTGDWVATGSTIFEVTDGCRKYSYNNI